MVILDCFKIIFKGQFSIWKPNSLSIFSWQIQRGKGGPDPLPKNHKAIGLRSKTSPDSLNNHKVIEPALNVGPSAFGPLLAVFGSSFPPSHKKAIYSLCLKSNGVCMLYTLTLLCCQV